MHRADEDLTLWLSAFREKSRSMSMLVNLSLHTIIIFLSHFSHRYIFSPLFISLARKFALIYFKFMFLPTIRGLVRPKGDIVILPSEISLSRISQAKMVGFSLLYCSILATTAGVATFGLLPPIRPGGRSVPGTYDKTSFKDAMHWQKHWPRDKIVGKWRAAAWLHLYFAPHSAARSCQKSRSS